MANVLFSFKKAANYTSTKFIIYQKLWKVNGNPGKFCLEMTENDKFLTLAIPRPSYYNKPTKAHRKPSVQKAEIMSTKSGETAEDV